MTLKNQSAINGLIIFVFLTETNLLMKNLAIISLIFFTSLLKAQNERFSVTDDGLTNFVVTEIPSVDKDIAYKKTLDWINRTFDTPEKVIKGTIENEYIRIEGIGKNSMRYPAVGGIVYAPIKFEIEISFKDNKYKFDVIKIQEEDVLYPQFTSSPFTDLDMSKHPKSSGYNKVRKTNGEFRNRYKYILDIPDYLNKLNDNLKEYLLGSKKTDDNW